MEQEIKSIIEAFSIQPNHISVCLHDHEHNPKYCIERIVPETHQVDSDKACDFYVGYFFGGKKAFEYLRSSVNVNYKP